MSTVEELLVRDIAAVTGGVIVTDSELLEARRELAERIDSKPRRAALRSWAPAAAAAVVLLLVGATAYLTLGDDDHASRPANPAPDSNDPDDDYLTGSDPSTQLIAGVWRLDNGRVAVKFTSTGTVQFDEGGTLFSRPATTGTYVIDGDLITVTTTKDAQQGCVGTTFAMRASVPKSGELRFVPSSDVSGPCSPVPNVAQGAWEQVLPASQAITDLVFSTDADWQPLSDKTLLYGDWTAEGGGHVLEIDAGGAYYVANSSADVVDRGTWSFSGSTFTMTSSAASTTCRAGDKLVLGAVQYEDPSTRGLRGTVKQNTCGAAWTPAAWILLPHESS